MKKALCFILVLLAMSAAAPVRAAQQYVTQYVYDGTVYAENNRPYTPPATVPATPYQNYIRKSYWPDARITAMTGSVHFRADGDHYNYNQLNPGLGLNQPVNSWFSFATGFYYNSYRRLTMYGGGVFEPVVHDWSTGKIKLGVQVGLASGYRTAENAYQPLLGSFVVSYIHRANATAKDGFGVDLLFIPQLGSSTGVLALQLSYPLGFSLY